MGEPATAAGSAVFFKLLGFPLVAAIAAGVVAMVMTPGSTPRQFFGKLLVTILSSVFLSPSVIQYFGLVAWPLEAQNGIVFLTGVPSWLVLSIVVGVLERLQGKSISEISDEIKKIRE